MHAILALCLALAPSCSGPAEPSGGGSTVEALRATARARFLATAPAASVGTAERPRAELGRALFFDPAISIDGSVACASCHLPERWGSDGRPVPIGALGRAAPRNAPTVLDAWRQPSQHWRGDRESLEDQASRSLTGPAAFGHESAAAASAAIVAAGYAPAFERAFPGAAEPVSPDTFAEAIAAYERTLTTRAPFDRFLEGDDAALDDTGREGLARFLELGCASCHDGPLLGGRRFARFGLVHDFRARTGSSATDRGRADVTGDEGDADVYKVPSLRHVAQTAPYFHDGRVARLEDAVEIMAWAQLGRDLSPEDVRALVAFLRTLTGEVPAHFAPPVAPGSTH